MKLLKSLWALLRSGEVWYLPLMLSDWKDKQSLATENIEREQKLISFGVISGHWADNPAWHIGAALKLAKKHNLVIESGLSFGSVRVYLPPELFPKGIRFSAMFACPPPDNAPNSAWVDRPTLQAAVCDCLIMCLEHGLVEPTPPYEFMGMDELLTGIVEQ